MKTIERFQIGVYQHGAVPIYRYRVSLDGRAFQRAFASVAEAEAFCPCCGEDHLPNCKSQPCREWDEINAEQTGRARWWAWP